MAKKKTELYMSENYMYSDFTPYYPNENEQRPDVKAKTKNKITVLKVLVFLLGAVLVLEGLLYLVVIPATSQVHVTFIGLQNLRAEDLGKKLSLH